MRDLAEGKKREGREEQRNKVSRRIREKKKMKIQINLWEILEIQRNRRFAIFDGRARKAN